MQIFEMREIAEAYEHAKTGGQALHVHSLTFGHPLFKRYPEIAHLFDQNLDRLILTAKQLGVRRVKVEYSGTHRQHVDLCGMPLARAKKRATEKNES